MDLLDLVGNTPLIEVKNFDTGPCRLFLKLESQNPGGSIKDRIAVSMIDDAEKRGVIQPGATLIEATVGNTGVGLALIANLKGYRIKLVVPDKTSREKISQLRALGAEVVLTRSDVGKGHPDYYQDYARRLASELPGAWYVDQFSNPANPATHEKTTGPEIWQQMNHRVDAVVVGVGSGGTLGGLTKYFSKVSPSTEVVIADPIGSIIAPFIQTGTIPSEVGSWVVEGIGEDFIPSNADFSLTKKAYAIPDSESLCTARELLRTNGVMAGSSTGTLMAGALRYCREQVQPKHVVTFACDSGQRYLSKMYNDTWMVENGFLPRSFHGDLRDLITRDPSEGALIHLTPDDTLQTAYARMKGGDVSQLPVMDNGKIAGMVDESDLLLALHRDRSAFSTCVRAVMATNLEKLHPRDSFERVLKTLERGMVAIVADEVKFYGMITKVDAVDYLRRTR